MNTGRENKISIIRSVDGKTSNDEITPESRLKKRRAIDEESTDVPSIRNLNTAVGNTGVAIIRDCRALIDQ